MSGFDSDRDGSWDFDARAERDFARESSPIGRVPRQLDPRGSVRVASMPKCERDHEAMKLDDAVWSALKHIGSMPSYDKPGQPDLLELRNCSCGSTLARPYFARTEAALNILRKEGLL